MITVRAPFVSQVSLKKILFLASAGGLQNHCEYRLYSVLIVGGSLCCQDCFWQTTIKKTRRCVSDIIKTPILKNVEFFHHFSKFSG